LEVQDNEGQGNQKGVGWRLNIIPKNWSYIVPDAPQRGYLFVYFHNSFERSNCTTGNAGQLGDKYTGGVCSNVESRPNSRNFFQGPIFAVVISKISQINALNRTFAADSNGSFLSNKINDTKDINYTMLLNSPDFYVRKFINDIRSSNNDDTTPLILYNPVHPLLVLGENYTNFSCSKNDNFSIFDYFIFIISFSANSNSLSLSDVMKLPFNVNSISGSDVAELGNNNTTIKFLSPGTCTIYYQIQPFNDVENIFKNPNGPSLYGVKGFSLRINVFLF